jgi:predicted lipid-binding transport protein (Tim44 family)
MTRRRLLLIAFAALALALLLAPEALAAAGGGSAGFGGGGGGGGGGRGFGLYILIQVLIRIAIIGHGLGALILIGLLVLALLFTNLGPRLQSFWAAQQSSGHSRTRSHRSSQRVRRVELAAAEAAEEDPAFAPEAVRAQAASLFKRIQSAWSAGDRRRLGQLVAPELLAEWERRLNDLERRGWRNRVELLGQPTVEYVGLKHGGDPSGDRVTVRVDARLRDYVEDRYGNHLKRAGRLSEFVRVREFWTLVKRNERWVLGSIELGREGAHALEDRIVATPWSDEQAMRDEALVEQAVADAAPNVAEVADLAFDGTARAAALDLSVADGRFAPDVLEVAARRAVAAWAEAIDGDDAPLRAIAAPDAVRELLHPGDPSGRTRLVVRGPMVRQIRITGLDAGAQPPTMTIAVELEGRRYTEDRDTTAVLAGSRSRPARFTENWTFALEGDGGQPWRVSAVAAAPARM